MVIDCGFLSTGPIESALIMVKNWIAVACADHVQRGRIGGFMQVCHGKAGPLRRIKPDDRIVYYYHTQEFGAKIKLQAFTAIGIVKAGEPYAFDMGGGFCPFRRDVAFFEAFVAPIKPMLDRLEFSANQRNWGYQFRFGLFEISTHDMDVIKMAMGVRPMSHNRAGCER